MVEIAIDPILAQWGPFTLSWHGLCLAAGMLVFYLLAVRQGQQAGLSREALSELALWVFAAGFAGARILHVVQHSSTYLANPLRILAVYKGGLTVNGAVLGALLAAIAYARRRKIPFLLLADLMVLAAPLAFVVGRVGCLINGDVAGLPTHGPWGLVYRHPGAFVPAPWLGVPTFPAPVALQLWNLGLYLLLLRLLRRQRRGVGAATATYLVVYGLGRFTVNIWQPGTTIALGLKDLQVVALALMLLGAMIALYLRLARPRRAITSLAEPAQPPGRRNARLSELSGTPRGDPL